MQNTETLVIGAGLAGLATALELLDHNRPVILLDGCKRERFGGQANDAFGGMLLIDTPLQKRNRIRDSRELALADWMRAAEFKPDDEWGPRWAEAYVERCRADVYDWLTGQGLTFFPVIHWVERGDFQPGNSVPRYHITWGCGRSLVQILSDRLLNHPNRDKLTLLFEHRATEITRSGGKVSGCRGTHADGEFEVQAEHVVVCSGGINGNLAKVREVWDPCYGSAPDNLLSGTHPEADGLMHDQVQSLGGNVVNLNQMWNYVTGITHPQPHYPNHGLSLIPARSALWMDCHGNRVGPKPLVTGFDTHDLCKRVGHLDQQYSWMVLNRKILLKEMAMSGSDENPSFRDKKFLRVLWEVLTGNRRQYRYLTEQCPDVLVGNTLDELADKMNSLTGEGLVKLANLQRDVQAYDEQIRRGRPFMDDDQLRRIAQVRHWRGDRLRTCKFQPILDPSALPLVAIRLRIISRKSMGGVQTDLGSRVLGQQGQAIDGLYAAGEAAGFGGGGISGIRSLEGTFLPNCIFNGRIAARAIVAGGTSQIESI